MGNGTISENDLMHRLVTAKKIMNKVDTGDYERGNVDQNILLKDPEELMAENAIPQSTLERPAAKPLAVANESAIRNSKLPSAIKQAMIDNPIPVPGISLNETLDLDLFKGAKRLMEQEGLINNAPKQQTAQFTRQTPQPVSSVNTNDLITTLTPIIENIIRKTLDEIVDKKLTQLLAVQQTTTINENLAIKVGDSVFTGKITHVKNSR